VKDPHVHVEHDQMMGQATMRQLITEVTGIAVDASKTVRTGCDKRRPYAMTSIRPDRVTCLPCREYAAEYHETMSATSLSLAEYGETHQQEMTPGQLRELSASHLATAANYRGH
jgi:hypothetical protein